MLKEGDKIKREMGWGKLICIIILPTAKDNPENKDPDNPLRYDSSDSVFWLGILPECDCKNDFVRAVAIVRQLLACFTVK